jgi:DNA-binding NarL/FixJ family response regulator
MITVSIVDDEPQLRQSIAAFINDAPGFKCVSAYASAEDALSRLPHDKPDVVLMDINMVGMTGIECVSQLKASHPEMQIVMLTVYEDTQQIFKALAAGATGYMLKRQAPANLLEAIRDVHDGGSPMSSSIARKVVASFQKTSSPDSRSSPLSAREETVLERLVTGSPYKQIAAELDITVPTVRSYLRRIYEKLHVQSRTEAVAKYMDGGKPRGHFVRQPALERAVTVPPGPNHHPVDEARHVISVAIVDDDDGLRQSIAAFVNGAPGFRCLSTYASAEAALATLPGAHPDVVLMDINLIGMSGIECVRQLKAAAPTMQIVMLTVYEDTAEIFQALEAGASGYVLKRLTPDKLLEAIRDVHAGGSPMSSSIARKVVASFQKPAMSAGNSNQLTAREQSILDCMARGLTYQQTADQLAISIGTIRTHILRIYEKLHVHARTEAVAKYLQS